MGKVIATYDVKVTVREPDTDQPASVEGLDVPTIDEIEEDIEQSVGDLVAPLEVNATATRTDV